MDRDGGRGRPLILRGGTSGWREEVDEEWEWAGLKPLGESEAGGVGIGIGGGGWVGAGSGEGERWIRGPEGRWRLIVVV